MLLLPKLIYEGNEEQAATLKGEALRFWQDVHSTPESKTLNSILKTRRLRGGAVLSLHSARSAFHQSGCVRIFSPENVASSELGGFFYFAPPKHYFLSTSKAGFTSLRTIAPYNVAPINWQNKDVMVSWHGKHRYAPPIYGNYLIFYRGKLVDLSGLITGSVVGAALKNAVFVVFAHDDSTLALSYYFISNNAVLYSGVVGNYDGLQQCVAIDLTCSRAAVLVNQVIADAPYLTLLELAIFWDAGDFHVAIDAATDRSIDDGLVIDDFASGAKHLPAVPLIVAADYDAVAVGNPLRTFVTTVSFSRSATVVSEDVSAPDTETNTPAGSWDIVYSIVYLNSLGHVVDPSDPQANPYDVTTATPVDSALDAPTTITRIVTTTFNYTGTINYNGSVSADFSLTYLKTETITYSVSSHSNYKYFLLGNPVQWISYYGSMPAEMTAALGDFPFSHFITIDSTSTETTQTYTPYQFTYVFLHDVDLRFNTLSYCTADKTDGYLGSTYTLTDYLYSADTLVFTQDRVSSFDFSSVLAKERIAYLQEFGLKMRTSLFHGFIFYTLSGYHVASVNLQWLLPAAGRSLVDRYKNKLCLFRPITSITVSTPDRTSGVLLKVDNANALISSDVITDVVLEGVI